MTAGLPELDAVLAVARLRSFRAAAADLGVSTSALSHAVAALEARLGVRLFHRTTRSVALTDAGTQFVAAVAPAVATIREAITHAGDHRDTPAGPLRINASSGAAHRAMPRFLDYLRRYPDVRLDIVTEGRFVDIVAEGFDAGIRLAGSVPQDMIAVPFGPRQRFAVVGSPAYFAAHGKPASPGDLATHACVRMRLPSGALYRWEFERHAETMEIDVPGPVMLDDMVLTLDAARAGVGLAYLEEWSVRADLADGTLVRVLDDWTPPYDRLCLYYPGRRHAPAALRALVALLREGSDAG